MIDLFILLKISMKQKYEIFSQIIPIEKSNWTILKGKFVYIACNQLIIALKNFANELTSRKKFYFCENLYFVQTLNLFIISSL